MASGEIRRAKPKPKIATIFISAHSLEHPRRTFPIDRFDPMEVRILNYQKVCGRHNFESPDSIRIKMDYWTDRFNRYYKSTMAVLETGKADFNALHVPRTSIAPMWRPFTLKDKYEDPSVPVDANQTSYYRKIVQLLKQIVDSDEIETFTKILVRTLGVTEEEIEALFIFITNEIDATDFMSDIRGIHPDFTPYNLHLCIIRFIEHSIYELEDDATNLSSIDPVLHEKEYVFTGNSDETTEDILGSFYGIHLIQNTSEPDQVHVYEDEDHITNDNLISGNYQYMLPDPTQRTFTFQSSVRTPFMREATDYFTPLVNMDRGPKEYKHSIMLSEILDFFREKGYNVLNIIDTGCRNVDADKTKHLSDIEVTEKMRGVVDRRNKLSKKRPFTATLGKKRRSRSKKRSTCK